MRLLLDTHIYLWFITNDGRLNPAWADLIRNRTNEVHLSVVSLSSISLIFQCCIKIRSIEC